MRARPFAATAATPSPASTPATAIATAIALTVAVIAALITTLLSTATAARAATADQWGFGYVDNPSAAVWTDLDHAYQYGTWKAAFPALWAQGIKVTTGRVQVRFPQIGTSVRGNVHVTAVDQSGAYCEIMRWGQSPTDEVVEVQCAKPGGSPVDTRFTVAWTASTGVLPSLATSYASVQYGTLGVVQSYNSTGAAVTVTPVAVGLYQVRFSGVGTTAGLAGNLQATAIQPNAIPRRCKVAKWGVSGTDVIAIVACFDATGTSTATEFTASYHRERSVVASFAPPKMIGYVWTAGAGQTNFNYPAGGFGFNSFGPGVPVGRELIKYPLLGQKETHTQATAYGETSSYCNLSDLWTQTSGTALVDVLCFDNAGATTQTPFFSSFTSSV